MRIRYPAALLAVLLTVTATTLSAQRLAPAFPHHEVSFMLADTVPNSSDRKISAGHALEVSAKGALLGAIFGALSALYPFCTLSQEPNACLGRNVLRFTAVGAVIGAIVSM